MPATDVLFFRESDGSVPVMEWLDALPAKVQDKCLARLTRLRELEPVIDLSPADRSC
jgi:hypothetical protein